MTFICWTCGQASEPVGHECAESFRQLHLLACPSHDTAMRQGPQEVGRE